MPRSDGDPGRRNRPPAGLLHSLHQAVRFAFPQRHAIAAIIAVTLAVGAINALEPLVIKSIFDELAESRQLQQLGLSLLVLALFA